MQNQNAASRTAMKVLQFPLTRLVLCAVWVIGTVNLSQVGVRWLLGGYGEWGKVIGALAATAVALLAYMSFVRVVERRPVQELSGTGAGAELGLGVGLGTLLFCATIGTMWLLGYYTVSSVNDPLRLLPVMAAMLTVAVIEELLLRAIFFRIVEQALGTWLALLLSAVLFGLLHMGNPNATVWAAVAIMIEAGIMLAAAYVFTRRLWLAFGIHFAWNVAQGGVFGVAVSGTTVQGLLNATLEGPELLTGGAFGAEASLIAVFFCLLAGGWFVVKSHQQGKFIPPFWRRPR